MTRARSTNSKKKRRGVFYTPNSLADILCCWAVREKGDLILEPSFGGCGFIQSLINRFKGLGSKHPASTLFGCDIDKQAFAHLKKLAPEKPILRNFIKKDFLQLSPCDLEAQEFDAVVGNPPYVSYHNMFGKQRETTEELRTKCGYEVRKTASLWAYFVLHSFRFLKLGGRAAWVLPGSLLNSDYGKELLHDIAPRFRRIAVISLTERLFLSDGTEESSEILLCDGWQNGPAANGVEVRSASTVAECEKLVGAWQGNAWKGTALNGRAMFTLLQEDSLSAYRELADHEAVVTLGSISRILIGIVTGNNRFFVVDQRTANRNGIHSQQLSLIFPKFRFAPGLFLNRHDLTETRKRGERCLLVNRRSIEQCTASVRRYLETYPRDLIAENATFAKRRVWHCPDDGKEPDGFFPYMNHVGPRLVLNNASATSTNTIHRVYFNPETDRARRTLASISILTTFSQLSAEIEGRTYGAGVLKHEPSEAMRIRLFMPSSLEEQDINRTARRVDTLLRKERFDEARNEADKFVFGDAFLKENKNLFRQLQLALQAARARRY